MDGRRALLSASFTAAAQSFGPNNQSPQPPIFMTVEMSDFSEDRQLDVTIGTVKRLKIFALRQYNQAVKEGAHSVTSYWDGYIRALGHLIEAEGE
jgi:hypothetical protein